MTRHDLVNLILSSDLSQRVRQALDLGVAAGIYVVVTAVALSYFMNYVIHSQIAEPLGVSTNARHELVVYRAINGRWPDEGEQLPQSELTVNSFYSTFLQRLEYDGDGGVTAIFGDKAHPNLRDRKLTLRPMTNPEDPGATIIWSCGSNEVPAGFTTDAENRTDIAASDLPSMCRGL